MSSKSFPVELAKETIKRFKKWFSETYLTEAFGPCRFIEHYFTKNPTGPRPKQKDGLVVEFKRKQDAVNFAIFIGAWAYSFELDEDKVRHIPVLLDWG